MVMLHAGHAGTFFTEPQRAPSMKATFGKLHVQGFRSLQNILTATVMSRSHSTSEASEVDSSGAYGCSSWTDIISVSQGSACCVLAAEHCGVTGIFKSPHLFLEAGVHTACRD